MKFSRVLLSSLFTLACAQAETPLTLSTTKDGEVRATVSLAVPPAVPAHYTAQPVLLHMDYKLSCDAQTVAQQYLTGHVYFGDSPLATRQGRRPLAVRFHLFQDLQSQETLLGSGDAAKEASLTLHMKAGCKLENFTAELRRFNPMADGTKFTRKEWVQVYTPFLVVRNDQWRNWNTDILLDVAYHIEDAPNGDWTLVYTYYFSDEDSICDINGTNCQLVRYGRRTDIEFSFKVYFDKSNKVLKFGYHGDLFNGIGHKEWEFQPNLRYTLDAHPILFNKSGLQSFRNNTFLDTPSGTEQVNAPELVGYFLQPREEVAAPLAREALMFKQPWMFKVSDQELAKEGKLSQPSTDYLFALIEGEKAGSLDLRGRVRVGTTVIVANKGQGNLDRLGEDMWGQQAYSAVELGAPLLAQIANDTAPLASFELLGKATLKNEKPLRFFRLKADDNGVYQSEELTSRFQQQKINPRLYFFGR